MELSGNIAILHLYPDSVLNLATLSDDERVEQVEKDELVSFELPFIHLFSILPIF